MSILSMARKFHRKRYDVHESFNEIPNFQLNMVEMSLWVVLQVPMCSIAV